MPERFRGSQGAFLRSRQIDSLLGLAPAHAQRLRVSLGRFRLDFARLFGGGLLLGVSANVLDRSPKLRIN